jgi:hypothetical protein
MPMTKPSRGWLFALCLGACSSQEPRAPALDARVSVAPDARVADAPDAPAIEQDAPSAPDARHTPGSGEFGTLCRSTDECAPQLQCAFLPGFRSDVGYCSPRCPERECGGAAAGVSYCGTDVGLCVIGCPFSTCPPNMVCSFDYAATAACEPNP